MDIDRPQVTTGAEPGVERLPAGMAARPGRPCSVTEALSLVGEKWSLLAVREVFYGNHRFNEIARNTGAPRDRLAARLRALVEAGVLERREYQTSPSRWEYHLTPAGRDLRPVLGALIAWGDRWVSTTPPVTFEHGDHDLDLDWYCRTCGEAVAARPVTIRINTPGWTAAGPLPA